MNKGFSLIGSGSEHAVLVGLYIKGGIYVITTHAC